MGLPEKKKQATVLVAMSGGVDSSVTAAILKRRDYKVIGVFFRFLKNKKVPSQNELDARIVAEKIKIPFRTVDASVVFKKRVVSHFLSEYRRGNTPNPCIVCNKEMKFKLLFEKMAELGADYVATGHYVNIRKKLKAQSSKLKSRGEKYEYFLTESRDKKKDQSYFLYNLTQKQLGKIIFPIGKYQKSEVRKLAEKYDLPVHAKAESQDICFISEEVSEFLKEHIKLKSGDIVDEAGKILGRHQGLPLYTLGQRKGIELGGRGPFFVIRKDKHRNRLVVSNSQDGLFVSQALVEGVNWVSGKPALPIRVKVRTRYHNPLVYAIIKPKGRRMEVVFERPQRAVTPGQSIVFYSERKTVLGGGVIVE